MEFEGLATFVFSSPDPEYDSATQLAIGSTVSGNPLAEPGNTRVSIREIVEPASQPIETIFVEAPVMTSVTILEVAEAALLSFDRDTNMAGRSILAGIPATLSGGESSSSLVTTVRSLGF